MKLTPSQYRALKIYPDYHTGGFTVNRVLRSFGKQWVLFIVCAILAYFTLTPSLPAFRWAAIGMFAGAILRDISYLRSAVRMWPLNQEIYDWKKVSELIDLHERAAE